MSDEFEVQARRGKMEQIRRERERDEARRAQYDQLLADRAKATPAGVAVLQQFYDNGDLEVLRDELAKWAHKPAFNAYNGVNGQMYLNQLVGNYCPDPVAFARLLARCLRVPASDAESGDRIRELVAYTESVKQGAHPAPRKAMFFLSFFWALQAGEDWPCLWPSAERMAVKLGWLQPTDDLGELYVTFRQLMAEVGGGLDSQAALFWLSEHSPCVGLHPLIVDRCQQNVELGESYIDGRYRWAPDGETAARNARCIVGELSLLGTALNQEVAEALGRSVKVETPALFWRQTKYRGDGWVRWSVADGKSGNAASFRVWITANGLFIGLHHGWYREGWYRDARSAVSGLVPAGYSLFPVRSDSDRVDPEVDPSWQGEFLLGRHYPVVEADPSRLEEMIVRAAADLQPALDRLVAAYGGTVRSAPTGDVDPLLALVDEFRSKRPYPSEKDTVAIADRQEMALTLSPDDVQVMDLSEFRRIYNGSRYGSPGPQSVLNTTMRDASPAEIEEYLRRIHHLLWGPGDDADRIDELLDPDRKYIKGLGESVIMKLLAIVKPETYLPVFPYSGEQGKARFLKRLDLTPPSPSLSAGHRQVAANAALRARLDSLFPNDPWGQAQFMYWLVQRPTDTEVAVRSEADALAALADDLLVKREFITSVVELLRDKGQVVFYGPPGTGKTYVARALARALAPDPTRSAIVQFHPSTSYEDFFEGYRPEEAGGQLSYSLRKGPLALMAEKAEAAPGVPHVLVIDELNRANLPKVFGELLFLLEYRDEQVRTIYRPDDAFSLPRNLYLIGTMNTADRSIALVDAALRRRFHFVPFFPDEGEMAGLLRRWLEHEKQPTWVADLVEMVNGMLSQELGGPDLQLGPSYFMKANVAERMPDIWRYNIEPLIQDQLFGQNEKIKDFTWDAVRARFRNDVPAAAEGENAE